MTKDENEIIKQTEMDNINHIDPLLSDMKTDEIKTINKKRLEFFEDDNKPLERRGFIHYRNKPDKWVKDMLEGRK